MMKRKQFPPAVAATQLRAPRRPRSNRHLPQHCWGASQFVPLLLLLLALAATVQADDCTYITNSGAINGTRYTGPAGDLMIPDTITGLPVTSIGNNAFAALANLTNTTIPNTLTDGSAYFSDPQWTNFPSRFYRVRPP